MEKNNTGSKIITIVVAVILLAAAIGLGIKFLPMTGDEMAGQKKDGLVVQSSVEMEDTNINTLTGGKVAKVCVKEGDVVAAGDIIAVMDSETLLAKQKQAQASIKAAQGQADAAQGQIKAAQATYQKALDGATEEELAQAKAAYELAEATYKRMQVMLETEAISQSDFDQVATQYEVTRQQYIAAQKGASPNDIAAAKAAVEAYQGQAEAAYGQLEAAEGLLAEVESYLNETAIKAPIGGTVTTVNVSDGELVSTGLPIAVITNSSTPWISCKVMEDQLSKVTMHQKVQVTFPAYPDQIFYGTVTQINKSADFAVKRATNANGSFDVVAFSVKVVLDPVETADLYAGMTAFVDFSNTTAADEENATATTTEAKPAAESKTDKNAGDAV